MKVEQYYVIVQQGGMIFKHRTVPWLWTSYDKAERYREEKLNLSGSYVALATISVGSSLQPRITNG